MQFVKSYWRYQEIIEKQQQPACTFLTSKPLIKFNKQYIKTATQNYCLKHLKKQVQ